MNEQPRRAQPRRRRRGPKPVDIWRAVPATPEPDPIKPAGDPTSLLRSLGSPPLQGQAAVAEHVLAAVIERAAGLATALAAAGGVLAEPEPDE